LVYTYALLNDRDQHLYKGSTRDLRVRMRQHAESAVPSTANRRPLRLVYYEACLDAADAFRRERYLKSGKSKRYLRKRLTGSLQHGRGE
jgi:putative endonuclease